jgi:hypothetical protein
MKNLFYLVLLFVLVLVGCKKKTTPSPTTQNQTTANNDPTSSAAYYLVFYDGTTAVKLEQSVGGVYNGFVSSGGNTFYKTGGEFDIVNNFVPVYQGAINFGKNYGYFPNDSMVYYSFSTGPNSFGHETPKTTGFIIGYKDANNVLWSTDNGAGTQTGSVINISSVSAYNSLAASYVVQGTFNCTVYDPNGNSKTLTNGKFKSMFASS